MGSISNIVNYAINCHCAKFGAFTTKCTIFIKFCTILPDYKLLEFMPASKLASTFIEGVFMPLNRQ